MTDTIELSLPVAFLKAVALAAADRDIRQYLNTVCLEFQADGLYLVATDGHRLHAARLTQHFQQPGLPNNGTQVLLPIDEIDRIKPTKTSPADIHVSLKAVPRDEVEAWDITFAYANQKTTCASVAGRFPPWRRALPAQAASDAAGHTIDPALLADAVKALTLISPRGKKVAYQYQWSSAAEGVIPGVYVLAPDVPHFVAYMVGLTGFDTATKKPVGELPRPDWLPQVSPETDEADGLV